MWWLFGAAILVTAPLIYRGYRSRFLADPPPNVIDFHEGVKRLRRKAKAIRTSTRRRR